MERSLTLIALFAAIIAALGLIPTLTLVSGIPITAQSMGIMLCGTVLGAKRGALAVLLFLALVALGLPLLAGGRGGLGVFTTPWAGYLFGFPIAAYCIGFVMQKWPLNNMALGAIAASVIGGMIVLYAIAAVYYMAMTGENLLTSIITTSVPFMPGDFIKAILAGLITQSLLRIRPQAVLSRQNLTE